MISQKHHSRAFAVLLAVFLCVTTAAQTDENLTFHMPDHAKVFGVVIKFQPRLFQNETFASEMFHPGSILEREFQNETFLSEHLTLDTTLQPSLGIAATLSEDVADLLALLRQHDRVLTFRPLFSGSRVLLTPELSSFFLVEVYENTRQGQIKTLLQELNALGAVEIAYSQGQVLAPRDVARVCLPGLVVGSLSRCADAEALSFMTVVDLDYHVPSRSSALLADAIFQASERLIERGQAPGEGVLLIRSELQRTLSVDGASVLVSLPVEFEPAVWAAIRHATQRGIVVVEAVGESALDLDHPILGGRFDRRRFDSGAILVANRTPEADANQGNRIDLGFSVPEPPLVSGSELVPSSMREGPEATVLAAELVAQIQQERFDVGLMAFDPAEIRDFLVASGRPEPSRAERKVGVIPEPGKDVDNAPSFARADQFFVPEGASFIDIPFESLLENDFDPDGDPLVIDGYPTQPRYGSVRKGIGRFTYEPSAEFTETGSDHFTYSVVDRSDGSGLMSTTTVLLVLNRQPIAAADSILVTPGSPISLSFRDLLKNDSDPDDDALSLDETNIELLRHGKLEILDNGYVYHPGTSFWQHCMDRFSYTVRDREKDEDAVSSSVTFSNPVAFSKPVTVELRCEKTLLKFGFEKDERSNLEFNG